MKKITDISSTVVSFSVFFMSWHSKGIDLNVSIKYDNDSANTNVTLDGNESAVQSNGNRTNEYYNDSGTENSYEYYGLYNWAWGGDYVPIDLVTMEDLLDYDLITYDKHMYEENISVFQDTLKRNIVDIQLRFCPYNSLCNVSSLLNPDMIMWPYGPCCTPCSCNLQECLPSKECCPDILEPETFKQTQDHEEEKLLDFTPIECISLDLHKKLLWGVFGISNCPPMTNDYRNECIREYHSNLSLSDVLPVLSHTNSDIYRNRFCAYCNGLTEEEIGYFRAYFKSVNPLNIEELFIEKDPFRFTWNTNENDSYTIVFEPPIRTFKSCYLAKNTCNVTGLWKEWSSDIDAACRSYISYVLYYDELYQNIFCVTCNGLDANNLLLECHDFTGVVPVYSFTGLLKINMAIQTNTNKTCSLNEIYFQEKEKCLQLICPPYLKLIDGQCDFLFGELRNVRYKINFRAHPTEQMLYRQSTIETLMHIMEPNFWKFQAQYASREAGCTVTILRLANLTNFENAVVQHCDLQFVFKTSPDLYNDDFVKSLLSLHGKYISPAYVFTSTDDRFPLFRLEVRSEPEIFKLFDSDLEMEFTTDEKDSLFYINTLPREVVNESDFTYSQEELLFYQEPVYLEISSPLFCPAVDLSLQDFPVIEHSGGLLALDGFAFSTVDYYKDNDKVYICVEAFENYIQQKTIKISLDLETIVSFVCTSLSISALIFTLFSYMVHASLRRTLPGKNIMALCISLTLAQSLYLFSNFSGLDSKTVLCKLIGALVHFTWLLAVFWMNAGTFCMFRALTKMERIHESYWRRRFIIANLYTICLGVLFIGINIGASYQISGTFGYGEQSCYISSQNLLYFTFILPVGLVVIANILMFSIVVAKVSRSSIISRNVQRERNEIKIFVKLSTITGITWLFGFIYLWTNHSAFSYAFILFNSSQGIFILIAFVANHRVLSMYKEKITNSKIISVILKTSKTKESTASINAK